MRTFYVLMAVASLATSFCASKPSGIIEPGKRAIQLLPYQVTVEPSVFETSFFPDAIVQRDGVTIALTPEFLGNLPVSSGRILATDPVSMRTTAFTTEFPRGRFPVELAIARFNGDERVAFARILFSAKPVAKWEMALIAGQKPLSIHDSTYYGYSVDAGTALFIDAEHVAGLNNHLDSQAAYEQLFIKSFEVNADSKSYRTGFLYAAQSDTLATFATGWGDGSYATYVGFDSQNRPCRLLTDFQVIPWR
ncbi:DUF4241 domain-containing protein [Hymenobacter glacieicola]|uniref:DUF4241 domain-containing protein n=1 Tax=Hymenobacter glacieicola TaxID=1562124 RepID=A0ABQ1WYB1_9BACT|nr:DUF4241 domain-containing protein [Hymenobacter glacieicola]GGG50022.1 hypothetical protein GCM10011378_27640 [Hymenobacter glacieicola]